MEEIKLTSYPEGLMMAAQSLDFLPEEARVDYLLGLVIALMMESA